ncbi:FAD-dependent thymidylate synthase [Campylobacter sp. RM12176]|uniref:FAD-dependent thymidylate synthase n=1 Tax=Campylobacter sp. RM12176 TaxID=2735788 RepID=UPI00301CBBF1|nr:FAD-dependent thymidylate synthase [Campylobacter sp. RM12176]
MKVKLLNATPLKIAIEAIRRCYDSCGDDLGKKDLKLLKSIIKNGHTSTIEHIHFTFDIKGISRAALQELARHRIASLSVESTRYTLKKLKNIDIREFRYEDYLVETNNPIVDKYSRASLDRTISCLKDNVKNDLAKYALPESYKTSLIWSINARSLRNFLELRSSSKALWELRELSNEIIDSLPEEYLILFKDIIKEESNGI